MIDWMKRSYDISRDLSFLEYIFVYMPPSLIYIRRQRFNQGITQKWKNLNLSKKSLKGLITDEIFCPNSPKKSILYYFIVLDCWVILKFDLKFWNSNLFFSWTKNFPLINSHFYRKKHLFLVFLFLSPVKRSLGL